MNMIRCTLDFDDGTDARLTEMAAERGQNVAVVLAEAVALMDSVIDVAGPMSPRTGAGSTYSGTAVRLFRSNTISISE